MDRFPLWTYGHTKYHLYGYCLNRRNIHSDNFLSKINFVRVVFARFYFYTVFGCQLTLPTVKSTKQFSENYRVHCRLSSFLFGLSVHWNPEHTPSSKVTQLLSNAKVLTVYVWQFIKRHRSREHHNNQSVNQSINQSKTLFNFEVVDSKIANISEENLSIKQPK